VEERAGDGHGRDDRQAVSRAEEAEAEADCDDADVLDA